ncbi:glycosyl transferase family 1 [Sphingomonas sp. Leaf343]|nr:glycosyl transferase family 1 [Sphingomonas sp. Leaf343]
MMPDANVDADVCLIVEGAYPFVVGGVANWVQDLIVGLPDISFAVVAIKADGREMPWRLQPPPNVLFVTEVSLAPEIGIAARPRSRSEIEAIAALLIRFLVDGGEEPLIELVAVLSRARPAWTASEVLSHPTTFRAITDYAARDLPEASFHLIFWAVRTLLGGLLAALLAPLPRAHSYHTISTGFAGLIAARASIERGRPSVITEHGIYLLERQIEIMMADWIGQHEEAMLTLDGAVPGIRDLWRRAFENYARACYDRCDPIVALYAANNQVQRRLGAAPERVRSIPNGIDVARFDMVAAKRDPDRPTIALIGRVVPIKDVQTFIRAAGIVHLDHPQAQFRILGPTDEDGEYFEECRALVDALKLGGVVHFEGRVRVDDWLPVIDVVVLTSLSEAQPLVILEAGACGIPSVAPDVGSCRELLEGPAGEDAPGGLVTPLVDAEATAAAIGELLADPALRERLGANLRRRVRRDYDQSMVLARYRAIYEGAMLSGS